MTEKDQGDNAPDKKGKNQGLSGYDWVACPSNQAVSYFSDEKPEEGPKVPLGQLYRFATTQDKIIMCFAFLAAGQDLYR